MRKVLLHNLLSNLYSALIGGGVFVVTSFVLRLGLPVALGCTVAGYAVSIFLIFPTQKSKDVQLREMLHTVLKEGEQKLNHIRSLATQVKDTGMRLKIDEMCRIAQQIFDTVKDKPQDANSVRQFSSYYLDTTIKIIDKYVELSKHKTYSDDVRQAVQKVEGSLDKVKLAYQKQLEHVVHDDVLDLGTEMAVLEETLELEGLDGKHGEFTIIE